MARRTSAVSALLEGFNAGYGLTRDVKRDRDLSGVRDAKVEQATTDAPGPVQEGATPDQVTKFNLLGTSFDTMPTQEQQDRVRQLAQAGILERYGDVRGGSDVRGRVATSDLAAAQLAGVKSDQAWNDQTRPLILSGLQRTERKVAGVDKADTETSDWLSKRLANPDGTQRQATPDDQLAASQYRIGRLINAGNTQAAMDAMKEHSAQALVHINLQNAEREQAIGTAAAAAATGNFAPAIEAYQRYIPDGAHVTDVVPQQDGSLLVKRIGPDGKPLADTKFKDTGQFLAGLESFKNPMAVWQWSQAQFANNIRLREVAATEKSATASATTAATGAAREKREDQITTEQGPVRQAAAKEATLRTQLADLPIGDKAGQAALADRLQALHTGQRGSGLNIDTAHKKDVALVMAANPAIDQATAIDYVLNKPDKVHQEFVQSALKNGNTPGEAVKQADQTMTGMGWSRTSGFWKRTTDAAAPSAAVPKSKDDAWAEARKAIAAGAPSAAVNERLKAAGHPPLPP